MRSFAPGLLAFTMFTTPTSANDGEWPEAVQTPRAEAMRSAMVDWCDGQNLPFVLRDGRPFCGKTDPETGGYALLVGEWRATLAFDANWWWKLRERESDSEARIWVLWLVDPLSHPPVDLERVQALLEAAGIDPAEVDIDDEEQKVIDRKLECLYANAALENPANVPVLLIGPAADQCAETNDYGTAN